MDQTGPMAGTPESRALTGLRGLAAMLVLLHHFTLQVGPDLAPPLLRGLLRKGYLGVDLFFVLSGFVISMVYGRWFGPPMTGQSLPAQTHCGTARCGQRIPGAPRRPDMAASCGGACWC